MLLLYHVLEELPDHFFGRVWWESSGYCSFVLVRCRVSCPLELLKYLFFERESLVVFLNIHEIHGTL